MQAKATKFCSCLPFRELSWPTVKHHLEMIAPELHESLVSKLQQPNTNLLLTGMKRVQPQLDDQHVALHASARCGKMLVEKAGAMF